MADGEVFSWSKLLKSFFTEMYWTKVIALGLGIFIIGFGIFMLVNSIKKAYFTKPPQTTTIGTAGVVNQDCSQQVQDAVLRWQKENQRTEPWLKFRIWKAIEIRLGNT